MEVKAITRNIRMSAQKMREATRQIHGMNAAQAHAVLLATPRKSAYWVAKTLKSAMANAEHNKELKVEALKVKAAMTGTGRTLKRFTPKARGSAGPIRKRSCNVTIVLSDE
ncbi:MAG: 50S ribosomal protein L22 [Verrucomicrobiae bacterium]|nr:50S ribosomal protein L22 [Verrucomicrobiae bacterium]